MYRFLCLMYCYLMHISPFHLLAKTCSSDHVAFSAHVPDHVLENRRYGGPCFNDPLLFVCADLQFICAHLVLPLSVHMFCYCAKKFAEGLTWIVRLCSSRTPSPCTQKKNSSCCSTPPSTASVILLLKNKFSLLQGFVTTK